MQFYHTSPNVTLPSRKDPIIEVIISCNAPDENAHIVLAAINRFLTGCKKHDKTFRSYCMGALIYPTDQFVTVRFNADTAYEVSAILRKMPKTEPREVLLKGLEDL